MTTQEVAGTTEFLLGNEAIARGALEAGMKVAAAYPGTPSSEIVGSLVEVAKGRKDIHVEWSINEKVATETVVAASFAGLRALGAMKNAGLNVAMDLMAHLNYSGVGDGGLVIAVCDDPSAWSSTDENDFRFMAKSIYAPVLEPTTVEEAKEMTKWAFDLSEQVKRYIFLRSVTRLSHTRENVTLGQIPSEEREAHFDTSKRFWTYYPPAMIRHKHSLEKMEEVQKIFESSPFNWYRGPENPELIIVACGSGWLISWEALKLLGLEERVGIVKLSTLWPLPVKFLGKYLPRAQKILVVEEVDPFIEHNLKVFSQEIGLKLESQTIYGKGSGHIRGYGELGADEVIGALSNILGLEYQPRDPEYSQKAQKIADSGFLVPRDLTYCPGCPHRASIWSVKDALRLRNQDGVLCDDIGCYGLEGFPGGTELSNVLLAMGVGPGIANGLAKLKKFGFKQDIVALCGDSTFYHACIPAVIDAKCNQSDILLVVLDNGTTGMTGFQTHPGTGRNAMGDPRPTVDIEAICRAIGASVEVTDPFDVSGTTQKLLRLMEQDGVRVLISQRMCELQRAREERIKPYKVRVDSSICRGDKCGCANYCISLFKCPGLILDRESGKAKIDETVCPGCGVCVEICPYSAITKEATS